MKTVHFDPFSGGSGDMILGALVDGGLPLARLEEELAKLKVKGFSLDASNVVRGGIAGTKVDVRITGEDAPLRRPADFIAILDQSELDAKVREQAREVIEILARAEAEVHGVPVEEIHFHEVGQLDALVDIVGSVAGLAALGAERVTCSPVSLGSGEITSAHGRLPVPAPATAAILTGVPTRSVDSGSELTTPTGAAILKGVTHGFGTRPEGVVRAVGYGAGTRDSGPLPNLLRAFVLDEAAGCDRVCQLEVNLDDLSPELVGALYKRLFDAGAVDVWVTPVQMKKGRPGFIVSVLCPLAGTGAVEEVLFRETSTLGVRRWVVDRTVLAREVRQVDTAFGSIRIKVGILPGGGSKGSPEFEDCRAAAERAGVALRDVFQAARRAYEEGRASSPQ